jgi:hypothetical protein
VDLNRVPPLVTRDLSVQLPALANATDYEVRASCSPNSTTSSSTSSPGTLTLSPHCSSSSVTIVASATTPSATSLAAMTVPLAASGTTSIVVSGYAPPAPSTATLHGFTTFTKAFYATFTAPSGNVLLVGDPSLQSLTSGAATLQGAVVAGAGGVELDLEDVVTGAPSHSSLVLRGVAALPSAIDFGPTDILPAITATLSTAGRPTVTWSTAAPVQGAAAVFELHPAAGSDDMWSLVVPPTPGTVPFPDLPANVWTSTAPVLASADLYESAAVTTYNANNLMTVLEHFPAAGEQIRASSQDAPSSTSRHRLKSAY